MDKSEHISYPASSHSGCAVSAFGPNLWPKLVACFCPSHPHGHIIIAVELKSPSSGSTSHWNSPGSRALCVRRAFLTSRTFYFRKLNFSKKETASWCQLCWKASISGKNVTFLSSDYDLVITSWIYNKFLKSWQFSPDVLCVPHI